MNTFNITCLNHPLPWDIHPRLWKLYILIKGPLEWFKILIYPIKIFNYTVKLMKLPNKTKIYISTHWYKKKAWNQNSGYITVFVFHFHLTQTCHLLKKTFCFLPGVSGPKAMKSNAHKIKSTWNILRMKYILWFNDWKGHKDEPERITINNNSE